MQASELFGMAKTNHKLFFACRLAGLIVVVCLGIVAIVGSTGGGGGGDNPRCTGIFDVVDSFSFTPVTNAPLNTPITSNQAIIEGFCSHKEITISGDGEYSINGGAFTRQPGLIGPNSTLRVRILSAPTFNTRRSATVAIGDHIFDPVATFSVTTRSGSPADAPTVQIISPVDQQVVNAQTIVVAGQASDPDGVASIEVNGVAATSTNDFATWWAEIPLVTGFNTITVASADTLLNRNPTAAQVNIQNLAIVLAEPVDLVVDEGNARILALDSQLRAVFEIDMLTEEYSLVSGEGTPDNQIPFVDPQRIAINAAATQAWVIDHAYEDLIVVDLSIGSRSLLVDTVAPDPGESLEEARDIAIDEMSNNALMLVGGLNSAVNDTRIISVNLTDGSRFILSDATTPDEDHPLDLLFNGMSEVFDSVGFRLLVMQSDELLSVDPLTGNRTVFSETGVETAIDSTLDWPNNRVIVLNRFSSDLYGADLNTGNVEFLWPLFGFTPLRIAFDPLNNRTLILARLSSDIYAIDMVTGQISIEY